MKNKILQFLKQNKKELISAGFTLAVAFIGFCGFQSYTALQNVIDESKIPIEIEECIVDDKATYENISNDNPESYYTYQQDRDYFIGGFSINMYIKNISEHPTVITNYKMAIDDIQDIDYQNIKMFSIYENNKLTIYAINNGNTTEQNIIWNIYGSSSVEGTAVPEDFPEWLKNEFGQDNVLSIIKPGDILKVGEYVINSETIEKYGYISLHYNIKNENTIFSDSIMAEMQSIDGIISYIDEFAHGDSIDCKPILIDVNTDQGNTIDLKYGGAIASNNYRIAQFLINTTESCNITVHIDIRCANHNKISSNKMTEVNYVPLYLEYNGDFTTLKNFMKKYKIDEYHYNDNLLFQNSIKYIQ